MAEDWQRGGRPDVPECLREFLPVENGRRTAASTHGSSLAKRQARHLAG
jgi:hypothetical protein